MQAQTNNTIKGGCIMDIWHRVGRIVRDHPKFCVNLRCGVE